MITEEKMKEGYDALKETFPELLSGLSQAITNKDWAGAIESIAPLNLALTGALLVEEFLTPTK